MLSHSPGEMEDDHYTYITSTYYLALHTQPSELNINNAIKYSKINRLTRCVPYNYNNQIM